MDSEAETLQEVYELITQALSKPKPFLYPQVQALEVMTQALWDKVDPVVIQQALQQARSGLSQGLVLDQDLSYLHTRVKHCRICPDRHTPHLPSFNIKDPTVVLVHALPTASSEATGLLNQALAKSGFKISQVASTSIVRCEGGLPTKAEIDNCLGYLYDEIQLWQPQLIVALGSVAATAFIGNQKINDTHGEIFWFHTWPVLATFDPAHALRSSNVATFEEELASAWRFCFGTLTPFPKKKAQTDVHD